jgi:DNA topoisomerase-1
MSPEGGRDAPVEHEMAQARKSIVDELLENGIRRKRTRSGGFSYRTASGARPDAGVLRRIRDLVIPPAWADVAIAPSPQARVQAVGRDAAGRWQYRYHAGEVERRARRKYERLLQFMRALPALRRRVARDLKRRDLSRDRVLAGIARILLTCFLRPGSSVYASRNGSFGIATLRRAHVAVEGTHVVFEFPGKSKKHHRRVLRDRAVARLVAELLELPGPEVFKFRDEAGAIVDVRRRHINRFIKDVMGRAFSAKDFRTWAGTLLCASALAKAPPNGNRKRAAAAAIRETAAFLGNTAAVCRSSYVDPIVLAGYERGMVVGAWLSDHATLGCARSRILESCERSLLRLLRASQKTRPGRRGRSVTAA